MQRIQIFVDPGNRPAAGQLQVLRFRVSPQQRQIVPPADVGLFVVIEKVGHGGERLRRGKGPGRAVPQTLVRMGEHEPRVAPLGGRRPERRREAPVVG